MFSRKHMRIPIACAVVALAVGGNQPLPETREPSDLQKAHNSGEPMNRRRRRSAALVMANLAALFFPWASASADRNLPDALLRVTVQQRENGKLNREVHLQELRCWRGECSLTSVTLNSCRPSPASSGKATPLVVERSSTREGNLEVANEGTTLVVIENGSDLGGRYVTTQRFTYQRPPAGEMVRKLIGYSGGFVKNSALAQQVLTVEFVPFRGAYKETRLDCPLGLPGVNAGE